MTIKEMEARTGLPRANIRYYENQGFINPSRGENGYRDYTLNDLDTLLKIKLLRQLHFSLEDIRAIQEGRLDLEQALGTQTQALEQEQATLGQAARLCRDMQGDGVRYDTLDASRYLQQLSDPGFLAQDQLPRRFFTWRRDFARGLDGTLYHTLLIVMLQFGFRHNMLLENTGLDVVLTLVSLAVMLGAETLMLHYWGTTPGKALFGLRIVREDGSHLSLMEAFNRTGLVVLFYGLVQLSTELGILSLVGLGLLIWAFWCTCKQKPLPWETEEQVYLDGSDKDASYWQKKSSWLKLIGVVACYAACVALMVAGHQFAMTPKHRGPNMTTEQFVENYNQLSSFLYGEENVTEELTTQGHMVEVYHSERDPFVFDPVEWGGVPDLVFTFTEEDGILTAVNMFRSFEASTDEASFTVTSIPYDEMTIATWSLLCGQPGISRREITNAINEFSEKESSFQMDLSGAAIHCDMKFQGYTPNQDYLFAVGGRDQSYSFDFTISLT